MKYNISSVIQEVNKLEPKKVFQWKDIMNHPDPNINKVNGKEFKKDVEKGLMNVVAIGKDSSNTEWYVKKF
ncbi:hypothetical protein ACE41D_20930 [Bacillus albus]|uniref:hypothetical protein n=1 Tax=Bacillus albus TaxID=2026189 RepID=UPI0035CBC3E3